MTILQRIASPTPKFFQKVRNGGLIVTAIGASMLAAPGTLSPFLRKLAGFLTVAGGVATTISQAVTDTEQATDPGKQP